VAALAADRLGIEDAMSWLETQGYTKWSAQLPPRAEVVQAFLSFELSPELEAIRDRPDHSAMKIQTWARAVMQNRRFLTLKQATVDIQRVCRGHLARQHMLKRAQLARIKALEEAQYKRRVALLAQAQVVAALEQAVQQKEELERRATAEQIEAAVFAATPQYEAERARSLHSTGSASSISYLPQLPKWSTRRVTRLLSVVVASKIKLTLLTWRHSNYLTQTA